MTIQAAQLELTLDGQLKRCEPLVNYTSFRIGGPAQYFIKPASINDIAQSIEFAEHHEMPFHILGNGTNTLFHDEGFPGIVLYLGPSSQLKQMRIRDDRLRVQAGASLAAAMNLCKANGYGSLDFLVGIPATIGGAIAMNAGIPEAEIGDVVESVTVLDHLGKIRRLTQTECGFSYRFSKIRQQQWIVLEAVLNLEKSSQWDKAALMSRRKHQPLGHSPGCVFKNPSSIDVSAGRLIDKCGLKGYNVGNAQVSHTHGNFILNRGNAKCADVLTLIDIVREKVYKEFNLELNLELEIVSECLTKPASGLEGWSLSRAETRFS